MRRLTVTYEPFDVVVVPFPFTDIKADKRRPALILSSDVKFNRRSGHAVMAMITSQKNPDWPLDTALTDNHQAGLKTPSKIRMKLFTLDNRLIVRRIGKLTTEDKNAVSSSLRNLLAI
jgi:mRNA interferase MazF